MNDARPANRDDFARLVALLEANETETPSERGGYLAGYPARHIDPPVRLNTFFEDNDKQVFAGYIDDYLVGVAIVSHTDSMPDGRLAVVEELYVEPPAREVGVGEDLLDACVEWARNNDCSGIDVEVLPGARSAKNLAERSGFTARLLILHRNLR